MNRRDKAFAALEAASDQRVAELRDILKEMSAQPLLVESLAVSLRFDPEHVRDARPELFELICQLALMKLSEIVISLKDEFQ